MTNPSPSASVGLCAKNPPLGPFIQTLRTLQSQTTPRDQWELIIIEDGSSYFPQIPSTLLEALSPIQYRTEGLGIFEARRFAITKAQRDIIIYVDDDNYLSNNYIEQA